MLILPEALNKNITYSHSPIVDVKDNEREQLNCDNPTIPYSLGKEV